MASGFSCDLVRDVLAARYRFRHGTSNVADALHVESFGSAVLCSDVGTQRTRESSRSEVWPLEEKSWVLVGRGVHPPLYDSVMRVAEGHKVRPRDLHHIMVPEEAFEFIAERNGLALLTKTGALRIARDGVTLRPLIEGQLCLKTYLASRGDNTSKVISEMVRAFGRKMKLMNGESQFKSPISA